MDTLLFILETAVPFALHSFLCLTLGRRYLQKERFHRVAIFIVTIINVLLWRVGADLLGSNEPLIYTLISIILMAEVFVLFKDLVRAKIAVGFGILIHFFACRSWTLAISSLAMNLSMSEILSSSEQLLLNTATVAWVHSVVLVIFMAMIKPEAVKEIILNKTLLRFIAVLMGVITVFFIYNSEAFSLDEGIPWLATQQIVLPLLLLGAFYLMLLFMIRLVTLDEYKNMIKELEYKLDKNSNLTEVLFGYAKYVLEIDVTENEVKRILVNSVEVPLVEKAYDEMLRLWMLPMYHPDDKDLLGEISRASIIRMVEANANDKVFDYRSYALTLEDGNTVKLNKDEYLWHRMRVTVKTDKEIGHIMAVCTVDEIHDDKVEELKLREKTERDFLTGAYNKEAIQKKIRENLQVNGQGALFVFDIDNFKGINDNLGHSYGDEILSEIHKNLSQIFRSHDLIGRFGGDEFVAFIHGYTTEEELCKIARRICVTIDKTYTSSAKTDVKISASIGIAIAPDHGSTYEELFDAADKALYKSKHKGKNTYTIYDSNMN